MAWNALEEAASMHAINVEQIHGMRAVELLFEGAASTTTVMLMSRRTCNSTLCGSSFVGPAPVIRHLKNADGGSIAAMTSWSWLPPWAKGWLSKLDRTACPTVVQELCRQALKGVPAAEA